MEERRRQYGEPMEALLHGTKFELQYPLDTPAPQLKDGDFFFCYKVREKKPVVDRVLIILVSLLLLQQDAEQRWRFEPKAAEQIKAAIANFWNVENTERVGRLELPSNL